MLQSKTAQPKQVIFQALGYDIKSLSLKGLIMIETLLVWLDQKRRTPNSWTVHYELLINAVQYRFQILSLPMIFRIEQFKQSQDIGVVYISLRNFGICFYRDHVSQHKFIHYLQMWPGRFLTRFLFFRVKHFRSCIFMCRRRQAAEKVFREHLRQLFL